MTQQKNEMKAEGCREEWPESGGKCRVRAEKSERKGQLKKKEKGGVEV